MQLKKVTKQRQSEEKKRFDDACGLAHAMELLGERWAMLVLRELAYGPRRFSELRTDLTPRALDGRTPTPGDLGATDRASAHTFSAFWL